jgi:hypothetical protein
LMFRILVSWDRDRGSRDTEGKTVRFLRSTNRFPWAIHLSTKTSIRSIDGAKWRGEHFDFFVHAAIASGIEWAS